MEEYRKHTISETFLPFCGNESIKRESLFLLPRSIHESANLAGEEGGKSQNYYFRRHRNIYDGQVVKTFREKLQHHSTYGVIVWVDFVTGNSLGVQNIS